MAQSLSTQARRRRPAALVLALVAFLVVLAPATWAAAQTETTVSGEQTETTVAGEEPGEVHTQGEGEEPGPRGEDEAKCLANLEGGGSLSDKDCKPPLPIVPKINEVIWAVIVFAIVAAFMMIFAVPRIRAVIAAREEKIRGDQQAAEQALASIESQRRDYEAQVAAARAEGAAIVDQARSEADAVREREVAAAEADAAAVRAQAAADIQAATERAFGGLRSQVAEISFELAERVIERPLDRQAQQALVERFLDDASRN
jgi:F-type H+-transporting ATPase subunit b